MSQKDGTHGGPPGPTPSAPTEDVTVNLPEGLLAPGQVLGDRYQIRAPLGRGGMGEVWSAFDLKLRVEVALKALRQDLFKDEKHLDLLRREVRAAREVVSPNVCRIFDLIEADGSELVSMEYVDGGTLLEVLQERGPLDLKEAQDIASQFLAGLEAIHKAGLVHRDVKPENIMITRASRVVLMDFGLARQEDTGSGTVAGTPAYMAPEQAAGQKVDARADVYAAGVVLAEMVSPEGIKSLDSRKSLWKGVRSEPAQLPDTPWAPVLKKAVSKEPDNRYNSAHTLTRALEDVTLRVKGAEDLNPYPGLAAFTEEDAEYFFGREAEVERMWRKIEGAHLLGIVGPSGAGKTSFIEAGLVPNSPAGWETLRCTPGNAAIASLARVVARETAGDPDAVELLPRFDEPDVAVEVFKRWRRRSDHSLLIVDQFEELFTLNPTDEQSRFAALLGRLVVEADVRVLLSMRDDFLIRCKAYEPLVPLFESLVPLLPPTGPALRRALVQPAMRCGYRFEDDELVEEMLAEVEGERGALPLLAFAMSRVWGKRDRESGLLTRQAYHDVGGVGGALAGHAEATIDRIGAERIPIVRELLRNLMTAGGTRAVREWDELLTVFDELQRPSAEDVLRELIGARLLTSYEVHGEDEQPTRRVEIIHESLLANWPRLVRWQTQDADAAQLRDQLRQAARTWDEHERTDDLLWTGSAYREYASWRERYPGGLTEIEESFAGAMTSFATRRRRQRRMGRAAGIVILLGVLGVVSVSRQQAVAEARRAEAQKLVALGQLQLEGYPTAALAYATASLGVFDTAEARQLAVKALWQGPPLYVLEPGPEIGEVANVEFSSDGRFLAGAAVYTDNVYVWSDSGGEPLVLGEGETPTDAEGRNLSPGGGLGFDATGKVFVDGNEGFLRFWSLPEFELIRELVLSEGSTPQERASSRYVFLRRGIFAATFREGRYLVRLCPLDGGARTVLGWWDAEGISGWGPDPTGTYLVFLRDRDVFRRPLDSLESSRNDRLIGRHTGDVLWGDSSPTGDRVAAVDEGGEVRVWSIEPDPKKPLRVLRGPELGFEFESPTGLVMRKPRTVVFWDIEGPPDASPFEFRSPPASVNVGGDVHPSGSWYARAGRERVFFWPIEGKWPRVLRGHTEPVRDVAFVGDGNRLISATMGTVRLWPLSSGRGEFARVIWEHAGIATIAADPAGERLLVSTMASPPREVFLVPIAEGRAGGTNLWPLGNSFAYHVAFSLDGRWAAAGAQAARSDEHMVIRVWDLDSGDELVLPLRDGVRTDESWSFDRSVNRLRFTPAGDLLSGGRGGIRRWDLETGEGQWLVRLTEESEVGMRPSRDGRFALTAEAVEEGVVSNLTLHDLDHGISRRITSHGDRFNRMAIDSTGAVIVTATEDVIRVGAADGSEPHLLFGHDGDVNVIVISPDSRWIATGGDDGTVRLWPMPDLSKPPLHTLQHEQLIAKLKSLTNLRIVRDQESSIGWKLEVGPFPGWETLPTW